MSFPGAAFLLCLTTTISLSQTVSAEFADPDPPGNFIDLRDGESYPVVRIGRRLWFGSNLSYETPGSFCYQRLDAHCEKYGRLYSYRDAQHACPPGWRLPSRTDVEVLHQSMRSRRLTRIAVPGEWQTRGSDAFTNSLGLSVLPAGRQDSFSFFQPETGRWVDTLGFHQLGIAASFWLQDEPDSEGVLHWHLGSPMGRVKSGLHRHQISNDVHLFSIRCICDAPDENSTVKE